MEPLYLRTQAPLAASCVLNHRRDGETGDHVLVNRSETGLAFGPFFQAEYPRLVKMLYLVTGDALESDDLAQEAMARA